MKKYDQIHESVLRDVFDLYEGIKDIADGELSDMIKKHKNTRSISSIARSSNDLICVFPVLASRNISIDVQATISKAIEKNCVSMLQVLFSALQLSDADNAFEYIQKFHTNINKSAKMIDLDDVIQVADAIGISDSAIQVGGKVDYAVIEQVKKDMKNLNFYFEDSMPKSLAEGFTCNLDPSGKYIVQVETRQLKLNEDRNDVIDFVPKAEKDEIQRQLDDMKNAKAYSDKHARDLEYKLANERSKNSGRTAMKDEKDIQKMATDTFNKQVINSEYKKANELMPTLMVVNFKCKNGDNYELVDSVIIGVKAKLYPMSSDDMITHIVAKTNDANWIQKFIKASTREISFFKDFLFAIDKAKVDALSMSRKGSSNMMWKVLERRARKSTFNKIAARSNDATAITTIVVSQNEVDLMQKAFQVDLNQVSVARNLLSKYNLIGICIVDESLEIAKFMWDTGEDMWETVSFSNLERESNDNTYKKVVNLMTKVM